MKTNNPTLLRVILSLVLILVWFFVGFMMSVTQSAQVAADPSSNAGFLFIMMPILMLFHLSCLLIVWMIFRKYQGTGISLLVFLCATIAFPLGFSIAPSSIGQDDSFIVRFIFNMLVLNNLFGGIIFVGYLFSWNKKRKQIA
jgi:hypothetical protein